MKYEKMSLKDHKTTADDLFMVEYYLRRILFRCQKHFTKQSKVMVSLGKILIDGFLSKVKCELDNKFHQLITKEEFKKLGHIYYSKNKKEDEKEKRNRFNEIRNNSEFEHGKTGKGVDEFI